MNPKVHRFVGFCWGASAPPQTSAVPQPPPGGPAGFLCTRDCGACCCPGCHAVNGTCFLCAAGSFSPDCSDHLQSSCRSCPPGFLCPQGAVQPHLPSSTVAVIVAGVVAVHIILSCIFIRTKHLKVKDAKLWILVVMIFGPIAWLFWWFRHRALNQPQTPGHALGSSGHPESGLLLNSVTPGCALNQPLLAEPQASAPPVDNDEAQIAKPFAAAADAVAKPEGAHAVASAPPLDIHKKQTVTPSAAAAAAVDVAAKQHGAHAGGRVVEPAVYDHQRPGVLASQAPNYDDISADMTDQCFPFLLHFPPLLPPTSYRHLPPSLPSVSLTQFTCVPQLSPPLLFALHEYCLCDAVGGQVFHHGGHERPCDGVRRLHVTRLLRLRVFVTRPPPAFVICPRCILRRSMLTCVVADMSVPVLRRGSQRAEQPAQNQALNLAVSACVCCCVRLVSAFCAARACRIA